MRTTIDLPDQLYRQAKKTAAGRGSTLKDLVEQALAHELQSGGAGHKKSRLPLPAIRVPSDAPVLRLSARELAQADSDEEVRRFNEIAR